MIRQVQAMSHRLGAPQKEGPETALWHAMLMVKNSQVNKGQQLLRHNPITNQNYTQLRDNYIFSNTQKAWIRNAPSYISK